jgi:hypothetical protein
MCRRRRVVGGHDCLGLSGKDGVVVMELRL